MAESRPGSAVAIRYDESAPVPFVLASGRGHLAERLIGLAKEHGVPVLDAPDLAERLITVDPGTSIPEELFAPVAEILAFVLQMDEHVRQNRHHEKNISQ